MTYVADPSRYQHAGFRRCGRSGLDLPPISLGLWHNFGGTDVYASLADALGDFNALPSPSGATALTVLAPGTTATANLPAISLPPRLISAMALLPMDAPLTVPPRISKRPPLASTFRLTPPASTISISPNAMVALLSV